MSFWSTSLDSVYDGSDLWIFLMVITLNDVVLCLIYTKYTYVVINESEVRLMKKVNNIIAPSCEGNNGWVNT